MKNIKNKFVVSIILVVSVNLLLFFVVVFLWNGISSKKKLVLDIKEQLVLYEKRIDHVNQLEQILEETEEARLKIEPLFVDEDSMVVFIEELESLADNVGVELEIKGVRFVGEDKKPLFTLSANGSFENIYYFITLLENMTYIAEFSKVDIDKGSGPDNWASLLELKLLSFKNAQD